MQTGMSSTNLFSSSLEKFADRSSLFLLLQKHTPTFDSRQKPSSWLFPFSLREMQAGDSVTKLLLLDSSIKFRDPYSTPDRHDAGHVFLHLQKRFAYFGDAGGSRTREWRFCKPQR